MRKFYRQTFMLMILALGLLTLTATPAEANFITSADVNLTCNSYTINVRGGHV